LVILAFLLQSLRLCVSAGITIQSEPSFPPPGAQTLLSVNPQEARDSARFVNGDRLTGTVNGMEEQEVLFTLDLTDETARFPVKNFAEVRFAGPPYPPPERSDVVYLRDGSYLTARVSGLKSAFVEAETAFGQTLAIPRGEVMGMGFHRRDDVLFENDFSQGKETGLVSVFGSWRVEKGQLVQAAPLPFCRAYVAAWQAGVTRYEWTIDVSRSRIAGLAFFASRYDRRLGQLAYMVMLRRRELYLYKIIGRAKHQGGRKRIETSDSLVRLRAEYDPRSGELVVWVGNDIVVRALDPNPIRRGEYVLLHTEGQAAFDDVRITHLVGTIPSAPAEGERDMLLLSNGDSVSGTVVGISEKVVLKSPYTPAESPIDRGKVRCIAFAARPGDTRPEATDLPRISLWNGDLIFGAILGMDDRGLTVKSSFACELVIPKNQLRAITLRRAATEEYHARGTIGESLLKFDVESQTDAARESEGIPRE